jgi:hypothetical protein
MVRAHLPDDFDARPSEEQDDIVQWVMDTIWRAPRDDDDLGGKRDTYRCQFRPATSRPDGDRVFRAPAPLQAEYDALVSFKTAHPPPVGTTRGAEWRLGTVEARTAFFATFFGALRRVEPDMPAEMMSFLNAGDENLVRRVIEFIVDRRGHPTPTIVGMLDALIALFNCDDGFVLQYRHLFVGRFTNLPAGPDYREFCHQTIRMLYRERDVWKTRMTAGRSSFLAIDTILREDRPLDAYHAIVEQVDLRTPSRATQELEWARCLRRSTLVHFLEVLPLRRKDASALLLPEPGREPPSFAALARRRAGALYYKKGQWRFRQPKSVFKNHGGPAVSDVDVALVNWRDFYGRIESYLEARPVLLNRGTDFGQFFVKDNTQSKSDATTPLSAAELSDVFVDVIRKYGIYNPFTGSGAIAGLRVHRIQSVRHVVATHLAKLIGYDAAAARLFDSEDIVRETYANYTAEEKFEDADAGYSEEYDDPVYPRRRLRKTG